MKRRHLRRLRRVCGGVVPLVFARLCVSAGRWIYATQTGYQVFGDDPVPPLQTLIFGDGFFYLGLAAGVLCLVATIVLRRLPAQETGKV